MMTPKARPSGNAHDGIVAGRQIVPTDWIQRSRGSDLPQLAVGQLGRRLEQRTTLYGRVAPV